MSLFRRTTSEWNSLPQEVVTAKPLDCFTSKLGGYLIITIPAPPSPFFVYYLFYPTSLSAYYPLKRSSNHIIFIANSIRYNHQYTDVG